MSYSGVLPGKHWRNMHYMAYSACCLGNTDVIFIVCHIQARCLGNTGVKCVFVSIIVVTTRQVLQTRQIVATSTHSAQLVLASLTISLSWSAMKMNLGVRIAIVVVIFIELLECAKWMKKVHWHNLLRWDSSGTEGEEWKVSTLF